jgi:hypothetical protein
MTATDTAPGQDSLIADAEAERLRPGATRPWNPAAADGYVIGFHGDAWHAIPRRLAEHATATARPGGQPPVALAACHALAVVDGALARYERAVQPVSFGPCPECAWQLAIETGSTGREVALLSPTPAAATAMARAGADPMLARQVLLAILAAAAKEYYDEDGLGHPGTVELLAHATRHRPLLYLSAECAEGCEACRPGPGATIPQCSYPGAVGACGTCTLHVGDWAGEWAGRPVDGALVRTPCSALTALATRYSLLPAR